MNVVSYVWVPGVDMEDFEIWTLKFKIKKFKLSNFWKEIKLQLITNKYFGIAFTTFCLLIALSGLFIVKYSSTIKYMKMKGMPKYKQVWTWHTDIFDLYFWLAWNYIKICFRNISSAMLKWKECTGRIKHDCLFQYYGWLKYF